MQTWDISLVLHSQSEDQTSAIEATAKQLGLDAAAADYEHPDPRMSGIKHTIGEQLAAANETALEHIVSARYGDLMRIATRWECEAESDEHYLHFEGQVSIEEQMAAEFNPDEVGDAEDSPEERTLAQVADRTGYGELPHDDPPSDDEWPRGKGRLAAFVDDDD